MGLHRRSRVVQSVRVLGGFALELARRGQAPGTAVAKETVVANKLNVVPSVASVDAVEADGVPVRRVARTTTVKVVHRERSVRRNFVQTEPPRHCRVHRVQVVVHLVPWIQTTDISTTIHSNGSTDYRY